MPSFNIFSIQGRFEVLETTERSQTAVMILEPGEKSSKKMNVHQNSDQVVLIVEGELYAEVGNEHKLLQKGDSCTVRAETPHLFENRGSQKALTFNVYTPPEYPPDTKE